jgi:hypothetical protein
MKEVRRGSIGCRREKGNKLKIKNYKGIREKRKGRR